MRDKYDRLTFERALELALRHRSRFPQLSNPLADILDRLLIRKLRRYHLRGFLLLRRLLRNQILHPLRQSTHTATAVAGARPVWTSPHVLQRMTSRSISNEFIVASFSICADTGTPRLTCFFRRADR